MNKALIIWNVALTALVAFLFLQNPKAETPEETLQEDTLTTTNENLDTIPRELAKVVYINNDTLFKHFDMYEDLQDELVAEKVKLERRYQQELEKLEKEYLDLRERAPFMTQSQGEKAQAELMQKQQNLVQMERDLTEKFGKKENDLVRKIKKTIEEYLEARQEEYGYDFVLGKSQIGGIHYANKGRDITWEVIKDLNAEYQASKEVKNKPKAAK